MGENTSACDRRYSVGGWRRRKCASIPSRGMRLLCAVKRPAKNYMVHWQYPLLRLEESFKESRNSPHFFETRNSLLSSKELATDPKLSHAIPHPRLVIPCAVFFFTFVCIFFAMVSTCPTVNLRRKNSVMVSGDGCKIRSPLTCNFLQPPATSS